VFTTEIQLATPQDIKNNIPVLKTLADDLYQQIALSDKSGEKGVDDLRSALLNAAETIERLIGEKVNHHGVGSNTDLILGVVAGVVLLGAGVFFWWRNKA
jgi:hypothetical protein